MSPSGNLSRRRAVAAKDYAAPAAAHLLRKSKVGHLDVAVPVEKDVLRLEVTVKDAALVQVLEDERHLGGVETRCVVGKAARPSQVREELAADDVLHQQVEVLVVLEGAEEVDDERVVELLEDLLLRLHVLHLRQQQQGCGCERRGHPSEAAEAVVCA